MRMMIGLIFLGTGLFANFELMEEQTRSNSAFLAKGGMFTIMLENLDAIRCIDGFKVYLKADRLQPSDEGLMLVASDRSLVLLPKIYSDQYGCYVKSFVLCGTCGFEYPVNATEICCPFCGPHCSHGG